MRDEMSAEDLKDRLAVIESMIAEGRRSTESWGWTFVLWGIAFYVAIAWSTWADGTALAWPVTTACASVLTLIIGLRKGRRQPGTTIGRAVASVWTAAGISMILVFLALGLTGRLDQHSFVAILAAMLGAANAASGVILRWKMQVACAVVWWAVSVAACFGSATRASALFLAAIFFCQIVFGVYAMTREAQRHKEGGVAHA
jgi:hypothetical protein